MVPNTDAGRAGNHEGMRNMGPHTPRSVETRGKEQSGKLCTERAALTDARDLLSSNGIGQGGSWEIYTALISLHRAPAGTS